MTRSLRLTLILCAVLLPTLLPALAVAEVHLTWGGRLQTDVRFRLADRSIGEWYARREAAAGIARNENAFRLKLTAEAGRFTGVAEIDFAWYGMSLDLEGFEQLYRREVVDTVRLEANAAYVEATDLFFRGLDVRIGQQVIAWGVGDQFNPTNVINPLDLEDPLLFGEQLSNVMLRVDFSPKGNWTISGVMVPVFRPALLPRSAGLGIAALDRLPFDSAALRHRLHTENAMLQSGQFGVRYPAAVREAHVATPELSFDNMQWAARFSATVAEQDLALMFYSGRSDIPQAFVNHTRLAKGRRCAQGSSGDCIDGLMETDVGLFFPRMFMLGLNAAGELPNPLSLIWKKARRLGYRLEVGVFFPQEASLAVLNDTFDFGGFPPTQPAAEYDYGLSGHRPITVPSTPFVKWVVGLDYTFNRYFYMNVQWVHGFPDEFGAGDFLKEGWTVRSGGLDTDNPLTVGRCSTKVLAQFVGGGQQDYSQCAREILRPRLGDYLVLGADTKLLDERLLFRLFMIWDLIGVYEERWSDDTNRRERTHHGPFSSKGYSMVIFPEISYNFGHGFELAGGALFMLGKEHTKFGDPATGGHLIWTRGRFTY